MTALWRAKRGVSDTVVDCGVVECGVWRELLSGLGVQVRLAWSSTWGCDKKARRFNRDTSTNLHADPFQILHQWRISALVQSHRTSVAPLPGSSPSHPFQWIFSVTLSSVPPPPPPSPLLPLFDCSSEFSSSSAAATTACVARSLSIIPCIARAPSLLLLRVQFFCANFSFYHMLVSRNRWFS
ncbi:uncharacterized protein LOC127744881 [Arachis duranensis]|uniref:Uncharacterized protein LOC127744881 n=1 Tax=Arachis duranensis TaxID=130453 RepID=A0A9C6TBS8_ARADU|nr:uncharacterized protein LOC127744881 [Arachis duranensis]